MGWELTFIEEVVGMSAALKMGFELLRPWGVISSVGVHNAEVSPKDHLPSPKHCTDALQIPWYWDNRLVHFDRRYHG